MRTPLTALLAAVAVALAACGSDGSSSAGSTPAATTAANASAPTTPTTPTSTTPSSCKQVDGPKPKDETSKKPTGKLDPSKIYYVVMKTSCGTIRIKLDQQNHPKTANAFASLVKANFYDGLTFHRVVKGWVVQGGDPAGSGAGGPGWQIVEAPGKGTKYSRGTVAMAKIATDPDGAMGSQFFIVAAEDAGLPAQYAVAGKVKTGRAVVDAISNLGADGNDGPPSRAVVIEKAYLDVK